jgi:hypothetical protein
VTAGVSATCGSSDGAGSATGPGHSAPVLDLVYLSLQSYGACLLPACSLGRQARLGVPAVKSTLAAPLATTMFLLFLSALASFSRQDTDSRIDKNKAGRPLKSTTNAMSHLIASPAYEA